MTTYKIIDAEKLDADLKSIADKIRTKGGTTDDLAFPQGFKDAVDAISASLGGGNKTAKIIAGTITELTAEDLNGAERIREYALYRCGKLATVTIPDSVTSIGGYAFRDCTSLASITIPNSVTSIDKWAFGGCSSLTSINIPNGVTSISDSTFNTCKALYYITIPDGVTSIGNYAFKSCISLESFTIPNSVTSIGNYAFDDCQKLVSVTVGAGITNIGTNAFRNGSAGYYPIITFLGTTPPIIATNTFGIRVKKIIVPAGCGEAYKSATNWANFADIIEEAAE